MMNGEYIHVPTRNGEVPHTLADITKAKELLNWEPRYSLEKYMENREYDN
jgi:UDP-N-acetylglucosamine 4-epimerase